MRRRNDSRPERTVGQAVAAPPRNAEHQALVKACRDYIRACGGWTAKLLGGVGQMPGLPDIAAILRGRSIWIEVKTGTGQLSAAQREVAHAITVAGGIFVEVRRIEDLEDALLEAGLIAGRMLNR